MCRRFTSRGLVKKSFGRSRRAGFAVEQRRAHQPQRAALESSAQEFSDVIDVNIKAWRASSVILCPR